MNRNAFFVLFIYAFLVACEGGSTPTTDSGVIDAGPRPADAGQSASDAGEPLDSGSHAADAGGDVDAGPACPSLWCDGLDVVVECDAEGEASRTFCPTGETCVEDGEDTSCREVDCVPGTPPTCASLNVQESCVLGEVQQRSCSAGEACLNGSCEQVGDCGLDVYSDSFGSVPFARTGDVVWFDAERFLQQQTGGDGVVSWEILASENSMDSGEQPYYRHNFKSGKTTVKATTNLPDGDVSCVAVVEEAPFLDGVSVKVFWDADRGDLDVHMSMEVGGGYCLHSFVGALESFTEQCDSAPDSCYYANCKENNPFRPDWGPVGPEGDPLLLLDDISGYGPEVVHLDTPQNGRYLIVVDWYSAPEGVSPVATLEIDGFGLPMATLSSPPSDAGALWEAGEVLVDDEGACFRTAEGIELGCAPRNNMTEAPSPEFCGDDLAEGSNDRAQPVTLGLGVHTFESCRFDVDYFSVETGLPVTVVEIESASAIGDLLVSSEMTELVEQATENRRAFSTQEEGANRVEIRGQPSLTASMTYTIAVRSGE